MDRRDSYGAVCADTGIRVFHVLGSHRGIKDDPILTGILIDPFRGLRLIMYKHRFEGS